MDNSNQKPEILYSRIFSATKIALFEQCPKAYWFSYVDPIYYKMKNKLKKLPENIFYFQTLGKAVHNAITLFFYLPLEKRNIGGLKENLKNTWWSEAMWNKTPPLLQWGGFTTVEEEREYYKTALLMLENFTKMPKIIEDFEFLPMENFKASMDDYIKLITPINDNFDISGKFDLVVKNSDGTLDVIDFKTDKRDEPKIFQMNFYKLLAEERFQKPVKNLKLYFLRSGSVIELEENKSSSEIKKEVTQKVETIQNTTEFEANPSKLCKFCIFKDFCPKKEEVKKLIGGAEIEDVADDLPF